MKMKPIAKAAVCADGTTLSVQASKYHYSSPREDVGPYSLVEVGFIADAKEERVAPPDEWRKYSDGSDFPNDVYGYVPIGLVEAFIESRGGLAEGSELLCRGSV